MISSFLHEVQSLRHVYVLNNLKYQNKRRDIGKVLQNLLLSTWWPECWPFLSFKNIKFQN